MTSYGLLVAAVVLFLLGVFYSSVFIIPAAVVAVIAIVLVLLDRRGPRQPL